MSETFFIGDMHLGHKGIITFSATKPLRPFETIEEHDEELIRRWNSAVGAKDKVYMMGDFCFGKRNIEKAAALKGDKVLIAGNHDVYATEDYLKYFRKVMGCCEYKGAILTHMPVHPRELNRYFMNIHGHLHVNNIDDYRYFNVSAEQIDLTPIPYDVILNRWAENN